MAGCGEQRRSSGREVVGRLAAEDHPRAAVEPVEHARRPPGSAAGATQSIAWTVPSVGVAEPAIASRRVLDHDRLGAGESQRAGCVAASCRRAAAPAPARELDDVDGARPEDADPRGAGAHHDELPAGGAGHLERAPDPRGARPQQFRAEVGPRAVWPGCCPTPTVSSTPPPSPCSEMRIERAPAAGRAAPRRRGRGRRAPRRVSRRHATAPRVAGGAPPHRTDPAPSPAAPRAPAAAPAARAPPGAAARVVSRSSSEASPACSSSRRSASDARWSSPSRRRGATASAISRIAASSCWGPSCSSCATCSRSSSSIRSIESNSSASRRRRTPAASCVRRDRRSDVIASAIAVAPTAAAMANNAMSAERLSTIRSATVAATSMTTRTPSPTGNSHRRSTSPSGASVDEGIAEREGDGLRAGVGLELRHRVPDVRPHRLRTDEQPRGDLRVRDARWPAGRGSRAPASTAPGSARSPSARPARRRGWGRRRRRPRPRA